MHFTVIANEMYRRIVPVHAAFHFFMELFKQVNNNLFEELSTFSYRRLPSEESR